MAVTIAETGGHVTETALKTPLSPPVTMRRNDRSHSPKYAVNDRVAQEQTPGKLSSINAKPTSVRSRIVSQADA